MSKQLEPKIRNKQEGGRVMVFVVAMMILLHIVVVLVLLLHVWFGG